MKALSLALLLGLQTTSPQITVPPYPNAFRGGEVVAVIEQKRNHLQVTIVHTEEPFEEPVREALEQWRLPSGRDNAVVVVNFRDWLDMESTENGVKLNPASHKIQCPKSKLPLPMPALIVDPLYPELITLMVSISVVVRLDISQAGTVKDVDVLQGKDELNQVVIEAVRKWTFTPARDELDNPIESEAYAICVYRPAPSPPQDYSPSY
jgi:TonB family protein